MGFSKLQSVLILILLLVGTNETIVKVSEVCTCSQLHSQGDCLAADCQWSDTCSDKEEVIVAPSEPYSQRCSSLLTQQSICASTIGCAYLNSKCVHFSGCTSYVYTTHAECQKVSLKCTSDGISCILPRPCPLNQTEDLCSSVISSSGSKKCVWTGTTCRDQYCTEASSVNVTDENCNSFISGCVTTGRGCIDKRVNCYNYGSDCEGKIGTDGLCNSINGLCQSKECSNASPSYDTDEKCSQYRKGCRTYGLGCTELALKSCTTYTADAETCLKYVGKEGKCEIGIKGKCADRKCESASSLYKTDMQCQDYSPKCVTTGQGCVAQLLLCNTYQGTNAECIARIGSDGKCMGVYDGIIGPCRAKICSDAKFKTDNECAQYQNGCITNGVECAYKLTACSSYKGDADTCSKYIATDGNCDVGVDGYCAIKQCNSGNLPTTAECKKIQSSCVSDGQKCLSMDICTSTLKQMACTDTLNCQWVGQCVINECKSFSTKGLCLRHASTVDCFWTGTQCVDKQCKHANVTTDEDCKYFLPSCITKGKGCIEKSAACEQYFGTMDTCQQFKGENGTKQCVYDVYKNNCRNMQCTDNDFALSQAHCQSFMSGCTYNGIKGCLDKSANCSLYYGDQIACYSYNPKCFQDTGVLEYCRPVVCGDNTTSVMDYDCNSFMSGCVTKGVGCIASTEPCTSYKGYSINECQVFIGNGMKCWYEQESNGICVNKRCDHNQQAITDIDCEIFMPGCVTNGSGCQDRSLLCDTYTGDEHSCTFFSGNGLRCGKVGICTERQCSDVENPQSMSECIQYLGSCIFDGSACVKRLTCSEYNGYSAEECNSLVNFNNQKCYASQQDGWCADRKCLDALSMTSQSDCDNFRSGCIFNGTSGCVEISVNCTDYTQFTDIACQKATTISGSGCWSGNQIHCIDRTCNEQLEKYSVDACHTFNKNCVFTGTRCAMQQTTCGQYTTLRQDECKYIGCWKEMDDNSPCTDKTCDDTISSPSDTTCREHKSSCRFSGTNCVDSVATCSGYTGFTVNACKIVTTSTDQFCWYASSTSTTCTDRACNDQLAMYSPDLCVAHKSTCRYDGIRCQDGKTNCSDYIGFIKEACQQVTTLGGAHCWFQGESSICINSTCDDFIQNASQNNCIAHNVACRYNGYRCMQALPTCDLYVGYSAALCQSLTDSTKRQCWNDISGGSRCVTKSCDNKQSSYSVTICEAYLGTYDASSNYFAECTFDGTRCVKIQTTCTLYHGYSGMQCQSLRSLNEACYLESNVISGNCRVRKCEDNKSATTDLACTAFLTGCVTTGKGCISKTALCSSYSGTTSSCANFAGTGIMCKGNDALGQCTVRQCYHNSDFTTDYLCNDFLTGCLTNGKGCISSAQPCSSYIGNQAQCSKFKGNSKLCWSDSLSNPSICRDRLCSDNAKSIIDSDCDLFMPGCVSMGFGCIEKSAPCSSYKGMQAVCKRFKGENGSRLCWNTSDATSSTRCIDRQCSHLPRATNDTECATFMLGCVTDGFKCISAVTCSQFYGTIHSCSQFNTIDKPCKGIDNTVQPCSQLLCSDAPNNYSLDTLCDQFKSGCVTTGYGCTDRTGCDAVKTQDVCSGKKDCQFVSGCFDSIKSCSGIAKYTYCVNEPRCGWDKATEQCRDWQCSDASVLLKTHKQCQQVNTKCTTTGSGCTEISNCVDYLNKETCVNAISLEYSQKCIWDLDVCRAFTCEDAPKSLSTDIECKSVHKLCVTAGNGCTYYQYQCQNLNTVLKCVADYIDQPCLWINNSQCVQYSECKDIEKYTHQDCQTYSLNCTSDGNQCIPFEKCSQYQNSQSCYTGTDGICGWVIGIDDQMQQCQLFGACTDIKGTTMEDCQYYSKSCISDGKGCIPKAKCTEYLTEIACLYNGTDGYCFWDGSTCRLQVCGDAPIIEQMTHKYCNALKATTSCTTNSSICVSMSYCQNYLEPSCFVGLDGECIYALPVGQTSGTKTCRVKDCTDYTEKTTKLCLTHNDNCISNGAKCITKNKCATYTTQTACESDGTDGVCLYVDGVCSLMTSCDKANYNEVACNKKTKACQFVVDVQEGLESSECIAITCSSNALCQPIFDFNQTALTICTQTKDGCIPGDGSQLVQQRCYQYSYHTYTWNSNTNKCEKCTQSTINNSNNATNTSNDASIFVLTSLILFSW